MAGELFCFSIKQFRLLAGTFRSDLNPGAIHHQQVAMSDDSREENVYMAKLAEQAERYDEVSPVESHGARPGARSRHSRRTSSAVVGCPWQRSGFE